ncbi:PREDICTED: LOC110106663 [Prunus dulcis]|uniref:PREDICTED: LOC110106663 n=1 Tax=Prunus dulcis TaxID=3755 RepID=A0A5E4G7W7_PRUDU|nr:hypothetical protein L3X38_003409 [Prunus dulcis]VVA35632.1 PREDICTED: LOC110106663 [Prunus dulcis]
MAVSHRFYTQGHDNVYLFSWDSPKISIAPIDEARKVERSQSSAFLTKSSSEKEFAEDMKEAAVVYPLYFKDQIPRKVHKILSEFHELILGHLPNQLPHMRDIQHQIDLVLAQ